MIGEEIVFGVLSRGISRIRDRKGVWVMERKLEGELIWE